MSMFVCLCRGEHDALLRWPFDSSVTFTLIDQSSNPAGRRNVTYTIKPNPVKANLQFLGRPSSEKNASFGSQKFMDLKLIKTRDYVKDDTIFIKVDVESGEAVRL